MFLYIFLGGCFYVIESAAASKDTVEATGAGVQRKVIECMHYFRPLGVLIKTLLCPS